MRPRRCRGTMPTRLWPRLGGPASGPSVPPVDYLDWYLPALAEQRPHDLSQSGHIFPWDWDALAAGRPGSSLYGWNWLERPDMAARVAEREGTSRDRVALVAGTTQGLHHAMLALLPDPATAADPARARRVAVEMPSYAPVSQTARLLGCEVVPFHRRPVDPAGVSGWRLDRQSLIDVLEQVGLVVITPVLNPTGALLEEPDQAWLVEACAEAGVGIVSDEVYLDAARGTSRWRPMATYGDHCVSVTSLTKCYGLGPMRFGWIRGAPEVTARVESLKFSLIGVMAGPSLAAVDLAWPHLDEVLADLRARRAANLPRLEAVLARHGIAWGVPPDGIFGAFRVPGVEDAAAMMATAGREHGVLAVPGGMFDASLAGWLRVAWGGDPNAFGAAMEALDAMLAAVVGGHDGS